MKISIITLFPEWFAGPMGDSVLGRAAEAGLVEIALHQLRDHATDKHSKVDDAPFGGGGGMVMKPEPVAAALDAIAGPPGTPNRPLVLFTSPRGKTWSHEDARALADAGRDIVVLCGHYEGLDERIVASRIDREVSIGDFVLTGGEIPAMAIVDSIVRLLPGALGAEGGAERDSFCDGLLEAPHYTRPAEFEGRSVPEVLRSGDHAAVEDWRREQSLRLTRERRPDLFERWQAAQPAPKPVVPRRRGRTKAAPSDEEE